MRAVTSWSTELWATVGVDAGESVGNCEPSRIGIFEAAVGGEVRDAVSLAQDTRKRSDAKSVIACVSNLRVILVE